jgi:cobalt/nickel transport system permease protein
VRSIEESACLSRWRGCTVETCVLCAGLGLCALCIPSLLAGPLVAVVSFALSRVADVPPRAWLKMLLGGVGFALVSLVPLSLELRLQGRPFLGFDPQGLRHGALALTRSTGMLSATLLLVFTTPFPRLAGLLRNLRMPSMLSDLLVLVYRQIFLLDETAARLRRSLACRGGAGSSAALRRSMALGTATLFVRSLQRASRLEIGLASRGSLDGAVRFPEARFRVRPAILAGALAIPVLLAAVVVFGKMRLGA